MSGKHLAKSDKHAGKRKFPLTLLALVLVVAMAVGGTAAYLLTNTGAITNTFTPAAVPISINETINGTTKTSVTVTNTGNTDAYIRVAIVANAVDADGNIVAGTAPAYEVDTTKWDLVDGYYYYKGVVAPEGTTAPLFKEGVDFANGEVNILAQSIQAGGTGPDGKDPEVYAWGVDYNNGSWSAVSTN